LEYLEELNRNNNREWFNANKQRYIETKSHFDHFAQQLLDRLASEDLSLSGLRLEQCTYRIYRDLRFSSDKTPYKTHFSAYFAPEGKSSGLAGYYIHIEPEQGHFLKKSFLAAGAHCPTPKELRSIREEFLDNGQLLHQSIKSAAPFELDFESALKRPPKDFPQDSPWIKYIKLKDFTLFKPLGIRNLYDPKFLNECIDELLKCKDFNELLNRAIIFAREEM
jgi:uncharacterized protein (TIGR02453 family)